jgi:hypothetical protein
VENDSHLQSVRINEDGVEAKVQKQKEVAVESRIIEGIQKLKSSNLYQNQTLICQ